MGPFTTDLALILFLVLLNGFFSGSEIAIISVKKSRLLALADEGDRRARLLLHLKSVPDSFFATVQIGVTLVGTLASVYGGARMLGHIMPLLQGVTPPDLLPYAEEAALGGLVLALSYLSLVFGELIPKSLALHYAERFALAVAFPLHLFSRVFYAFTVFLTFSSNVILRLFKDRTSFSETRLLEEEIRVMLEEGVKAGTIDRSEHEIMENVFELNDTSAREIMAPRVDIEAVDIDARGAELDRVLELPYSRVPIFRESLDHIVGILHVKDFMRARLNNPEAGLADLSRPAYYVPESMKIDKILKEMQKRRIHMAIVVDEYGGTAGLLTMEDILEEIVGDIQDITEDPDQDEIVKIGENAYHVAGSCAIADFNEYFGDNSIPESETYNSIAGYVIEKTGRFPEVGEPIRLGGFAFELLKRVRQKLVQFRIERLQPIEDGGADAES